MTSTVLSRTGKRRWCEFAIAPPTAAQTLLRLYPRTQFLCLHRACPDVIYTALHARPWGPAGSTFAPFNAACPASAATALAAYWAAHTQPLLKFETAHPGQARRIRYEDLAANPSQTASDLLEFLGLPPAEWPRLPQGQTAAPAAATGTGLPGPSGPMPASQLPEALLAQVNTLLSALAYPPVR
jgi:hypothetical protein